MQHKLSPALILLIIVYVRVCAHTSRCCFVSFERISDLKKAEADLNPDSPLCNVTDLELGHAHVFFLFAGGAQCSALDLFQAKIGPTVR